MHAFQLCSDLQEPGYAEHLTFALSASHIYLWDIDLINRNAWMDHNFRSFLGINDKQEISYNDLEAKIYPEDLDNVHKLILSAFSKSTQQKIVFEFRVVTSEQTKPEWLSCEATIFVNQENTACRFSGTAQNITRQKHAEEDAHGFRYMADHARDALILMKQDGTFAYLNQVALDRWGYTAVQARDLHVPDVDPIYNEKLFAAIFERAQKEIIPAFETLHQRKDGSVYDVEVNMNGLLIGSEPHMLAIARDITSRKFDRRLLVENQLKLQSVLSAAPVGISLFVGKDLIVEMPNQVFIDLAGKGPDIAGKPAWQVMDGVGLNDRPFSEILEQAFLSGKVSHNYGCPIRINRPEITSTAYYDFSHVPISNIDGEVYAVLEMAVEVTNAIISKRQLKESEERYKLLAQQLERIVSDRTEQLADVNRQLITLNEELSVTNEELTASNEETITANDSLTESNHLLAMSNDSLSRFAYVASHDLQEPLRKIQQFGDLIKERYGEQLGGGIDYLERMQKASTRMSVLIQDLLVYSGISSKRGSQVNISLKKVIGTVLSDLDLLIIQTGASISVDGPLPQINGVVSELEQLFQNLISNAIKFSKTDQNPTIEIIHQYVSYVDLPIRVKPVQESKIYHRIDVKDQGIGFDQQYVDRIFQVFQRLHGKSEFAGTGIGLAICEKVAANHGGAITATSTQGEGATFSIYFPM